jgi:glycosyltransferase involved in cell wall biosynthesis
MTDDVRVSLIICAYTLDRWDDIQEALASIRAQTRPPEEVILVIDYNQALLTRALAAFGREVRVVPNAEARGLSGARNTGIALSTGEILAFLDDDAVAAPDWLALAVGGCLAPDVLGVSSWVEPIWMAPRPSWFPEEFLWTVGCSYRGLPRESCEVRNLTGGTMVLKREVFARAGQFNSRLGRSNGNLISCEETELCMRARQQFPGGRFLHLPHCKVGHKVTAQRLTWRYFWRRCRAEGVSKAQLVQLVQQRDPLSTERGYVLRTLGSGVLLGLWELLRYARPAGPKRAAAILLGLSATVSAYAPVMWRSRGIGAARSLRTSDAA